MVKEELLKKLNYVKHCLSNQSQMPVLSHFCFNDNTIRTFNSVQAITVDFNSGIKACVPGDLLYKLVSSYSSLELKMIQSADEVIVETIGSSMKLKTLPLSDFMFIDPELSDGVSFPVTKEFFDGIKQCLFSAGNDASEPGFFGITFESTPEFTALYSTDKGRLSRVLFSKPLGATFKMILPKAFCELLERISADFESGTFWVGDSFVQVKCAGITVYSRFVKEVDLIDFQAFINKWNNFEGHVFQAVPESFSASIDRSLILMTGQIELSMQMELEGTTLRMSTSNSFGEVKDQVQFNSAMEPLNFRMNPIMLQQALPSISSLFFTRSADVNNNPITVLIGKKDNFLHFIESY